MWEERGRHFCGVEGERGGETVAIAVVFMGGIGEGVTVCEVCVGGGVRDGCGEVRTGCGVWGV